MIPPAVNMDYSKTLFLQWCFNILIKLCLKIFREYSPCWQSNCKMLEKK